MSEWDQFQKADPVQDWEQFEPAQPIRRSPMEMVSQAVTPFVRQAGLTGRAAIEGLTALPLAITDAPVTVKRALGFPSGMKVSEALSAGLTRAGLPVPETGTERVVQDIAGGMAGTGGITSLANLAARPGAILAGGAAGGAGGVVREAGGGPMAQTLAGLATGLRPGMMRQAPPATSIRSPGQAVKMQTFQQARQAGFVFPPSHIESNWMRESLESLGGKAATKQQVSLHNQGVVNDLAKRGAGLAPNELITEQSLANARERIAQPYREIAALSPNAEANLLLWRQNNAKSKAYWREYERQQTVSSQQKYEYHKKLAEQAQNRMEAEAIKTGNPDLVQRLRQARVAIAQNHDVELALNVGNGNVRADVLGRMLNKRGVQGMSGPLGVIAKTQQAFPGFLTEASKVPTPGVSHLGALASMGLGYEGYIHGGVPGAALGLALPWARHGARGLALSPAMQRPLGGQQGIPMSALAQFLAQQQQQ